MDILKIFENYGQLDNKFTRYKSLINFLKNIHFADNEHLKLLKADGFANDNIVHDGIDFFKKDYNFDLRMPELQYKLFIPYIVEKLIVFADKNEGEKLFLQNNISKIYNTFSHFNNFSKTTKDKFLKKLMFMLSYEQIYIQENNYIENMIRLIKLYKNVEEIDTITLKAFGLSFQKLIFLHWVLFGFISRNKITTLYFSINDFIRFATNSDEFTISVEEINNFLNYVLITEEDFKKEYFKIRRKQSTDEYVDYDSLTYIDRYLPRISYWYPLLKVNDHIKLISYTSLLQFMKFDKLYSLIYHTNYIKDFKSKIHGNCVTNYIKSYAEDKISQAKIYGDEKYYKDQYQAPDIIIEFDKYVLIIEAKSKPFNIIKVLTEFDVYNFDKIKKDKEKSISNIKRYLEYENSFDGKKVYKFICYFFDHPGMISEMEDDRCDLDRIIITDIHSIESLLSIQNEEYSNVIDEFLIARKKYDTSSLYHFCQTNYQMANNSDLEFDNFIKKFMKIKKEN